MSAINGAAESCDILIKNVPGDVVQELGRRAEAHFRSRNGEIMAILAAVCRSEATLPGLGIGETIPGESVGVSADTQRGGEA